MTGKLVPTLVKMSERHNGTAQSGGATRISGVSRQNTPSKNIWFGVVSNEPGHRSLPHHHGDAETGGFVLSGRSRVYFGENYSEYIDMEEGDFVHVPPHMPHVEVNMSTTEPLVFLTARTPDNVTVNLEDVDDSLLVGYRRA